MQNEIAFQDHYPGSCYGCGAGNENGLQIKSYWDGEKAVCVWTPQPHHCAGPTFMNGGIIATIIDCNMGAAAMYHMHEEAGATVGEGDDRNNCVTGNLNIDYLAPTPMNTPVRIEAWVTKKEGRKVFLEATLGANGNISVKATAVFIEVKGVKLSVD